MKELKECGESQHEQGNLRKNRKSLHKGKNEEVTGQKTNAKTFQRQSHHIKYQISIIENVIFNTAKCTFLTFVST